MCTHVDHNEHSVQIVVTDQGLADLRGLAPQERAATIIDRWATCLPRLFEVVLERKWAGPYPA